VTEETTSTKSNLGSSKGGSLQRSPRPSLGDLLLRGGHGRARAERRRGKGKERWREGKKWRGGEVKGKAKGHDGTSFSPLRTLVVSSSYNKPDASGHRGDWLTALRKWLKCSRYCRATSDGVCGPLNVAWKC